MSNLKNLEVLRFTMESELSGFTRENLPKLKHVICDMTSAKTDIERYKNLPRWFHDGIKNKNIFISISIVDLDPQYGPRNPGSVVFYKDPYNECEELLKKIKNSNGKLFKIFKFILGKNEVSEKQIIKFSKNKNIIADLTDETKNTSLIFRDMTNAIGFQTYVLSLLGKF